jgi:hypothetical protein
MLLKLFQGSAVRHIASVDENVARGSLIRVLWVSNMQITFLGNLEQGNDAAVCRAAFLQVQSFLARYNTGFGQNL